jgi:hypothetical protein
VQMAVVVQRMVFLEFPRSDGQGWAFGVST